MPKSLKVLIWVLLVIGALCMGVLATCIPWGGLALVNPPLHDAAASGNLAEVKRLISSGIDPNLKNENGDTALVYALYDKHYDVAQYQIDHGGDVNAKNNSGQTPLDELRTVSWVGRRDHLPGAEQQEKWLQARGGRIEKSAALPDKP